MTSRRRVRQLLQGDGAARAVPEVTCELALVTALGLGERLRLETLPELRAESRLVGDRLAVAFYLPDWDFTDPENHAPARFAVPDDRLEAFADGVRALVDRARALGLITLPSVVGAAGEIE